ncbi:MAG: ribosomal RNA small subunit methyltransferase I, partial [Candidatus Margulisiibacteriota bacterium]
MGTLFIVATPIGNLEDISFRAVRILSEADLIAAEDTRRTKVLLARYNINTPMTSYHKFSIKSKSPYLVKLLKQGKNIALVSDAGMPGISDPGYELIRESIDQNIRVEPIPGPSAAITA